MIKTKELNFVLPMFLSALDETFSKSVQQEFENFLKKHPAKKRNDNK